jgi:hypothetical protein
MSISIDAIEACRRASRVGRLHEGKGREGKGSIGVVLTVVKPRKKVAKQQKGE